MTIHCKTRTKKKKEAQHREDDPSNHFQYTIHVIKSSILEMFQ